jgi:hypothetical protein
VSGLAIMQQLRRTGNFGLYGFDDCMNVGDTDAPLVGAEGQCQHRDVIFLTEGLRSQGDLVGRQ